MNILYLALFNSLFRIIKGSFKNCPEVKDWMQTNSWMLEPDFDLNKFINVDKNKTYLKERYLGRGGFGFVYKLKFNSESHETDAAVKVIPLPFDKENRYKNMINQELMSLSKLYKSKPLYYLKYFGCAKSTGKNKNAFLFTEKLSYSLRDNKFLDEFQQMEFATNIGLFLMMTQSLLYLEQKQYAHLDVKPDNFMVYDKNGIKIVKLIDYGLIIKHGKFVYCGTPYYQDPMMDGKGYMTTSRSDVYSLIWTFQNLLWDFKLYNSWKECNKKREMTLKECNKIRNKNAEKEIQKSLKILDDSIGHNKQLKKVYNIILKVITDPSSHTITLEKIANTFISILEEIDPESIYLPKNESKLLELVYGEDPYSVIDTNPKPISKQNEHGLKRKSYSLGNLNDILYRKHHERRNNIIPQQKKNSKPDNKLFDGHSNTKKTDIKRLNAKTQDKRNKHPINNKKGKRAARDIRLQNIYIDQPLEAIPSIGNMKDNNRLKANQVELDGQDIDGSDLNESKAIHKYYEEKIKKNILNDYKINQLNADKEAELKKLRIKRAKEYGNNHGRMKNRLNTI